MAAEKTYLLHCGTYTEIMTGTTEEARARVEELFKVRHFDQGGGWKMPSHWDKENKLYAHNERHRATVVVGRIEVSR